MEEERDEVTSAVADPGGEFTETKYLLYGLDLEEQQCVLPYFVRFLGLIYLRRKLQSVLASVASDPPPTSAVELRTTFRRRMVKFRQIQARYQPEVLPLLAQLPETSTDVDAVQDIPLYLPSSLPPDILGKCSKRLVSMEAELRIGQCHDSLLHLRTKLAAQARLLKYKYVHVRHQAPNTRSRNLLNRVGLKIETIAAKYRRAFAALEALDPNGKLERRSEFLELRGQDIRGMSQAELPHAPTQERAEELQGRTLLNGGVVPEGHRTISWIWRGSLRGNSENQSEPSEYGEGMTSVQIMRDTY